MCEIDANIIKIFQFDGKVQRYITSAKTWNKLINNLEASSEGIKGVNCMLSCKSTHQLELRASCIGLLYASVRPKRAQRHHVQLKLTRLDPRAAHASLPRHHQHALLLVLAALPADAQLVPGVHQHTHALQKHTQSVHIHESERGEVV